MKLIKYVALLLFFASYTKAENLLVNPDFSTNLNGWTVASNGGIAQWLYFGVPYTPTGGALDLGAGAMASQCVSATSLVAGNFSSWVFVQSGMAGIPPSNGVHLSAFDSPNCTGTLLTDFTPPFTPSVDDPTWGAFAWLNQSLPATTLSVLFELRADVDQDHWFDHAYLAPEIVFSNGFEN